MQLQDPVCSAQPYSLRVQTSGLILLLDSGIEIAFKGPMFVHNKNSQQEFVLQVHCRVCMNCMISIATKALASGLCFGASLPA
jgi:hypothetical protein